jgi:hypothetical protein
MKGILFVLILVGAGVVCLGFYLGWFHIGSENADGKSNVTFSVDTDKIQKDKTAALATVEGVGHQIKTKVTGSSERSMDGTVVSVSADKLTMTNTAGKEHSHALAANVNVTCDGKACKAGDLQSGMRVRVTTEATAPHAATRIEALEHNQDFEKGA